MKNEKKGFSIKRGRVRSAQNAMGSAFGVVFSIIWTVVAIKIGAPWFFALFGVMFIAMSAVNAFINIKNATSQNRYSEFDVMDINSEPDPWDEKFADKPEAAAIEVINNAMETEKAETRFCPYCGTETENDFEFCRSCGRQLPD